MPNARRSLRLSIPPLWLIGVCLFLPTVRACSKMESPASLLVGDKGAFVALLAPYLVAQLLVILTIVALGRGSRRARREPRGGGAGDGGGRVVGDAGDGVLP